MAHITFLDETMRDGQQSLWGMRMQAGMALPVAPIVDQTGYNIISLAGSSLFEVLIRHCQEDPWAGLDMLVAAMPRTPAPRRNAVERLRDVRIHARLADGSLDEPAHRARHAELLDLRRALRHREDGAPRKAREGSRVPGRRLHALHAFARARRRVLRGQSEQALGPARRRQPASLRHRRRPRSRAHLDARARDRQERARQADRDAREQHARAVREVVPGCDRARGQRAAHRGAADGEWALGPVDRDHDEERRDHGPHPQRRYEQASARCGITSRRSGKRPGIS